MFAKAFRLFVSSTFQDFGDERRLLQERVFPVLDAHCAAQGFSFRAVDMRWGVSNDAQLNQRTAEICLDEVIEARGYPAPNLLILMGDRYGWVPLPFSIARDEFQAVRAWMVAQGQNEAAADLERVYALDENHLVPSGLTATRAGVVGAYTLRSREDELSDLKAAENWVPVEARLRDALQVASRNLHANGELPAAELEKYTLSLTEQEIRKGLDTLGVGDGAGATNSIAWLRTNETSERSVRKLAEVVQRALPHGNVLHAELQAGTAGYGERFVAQITVKLISVIDAQMAAFKTRAAAADFSLQTERVIHAAFAAERLRVFVGRGGNLAAIAAHLASEARHPLVLTGVSGSGKTALMARAAAEARGVVVQRYIGASVASSSQRDLLISIIEELAARGATVMPAQWEDDENRFVKQVHDILAEVDTPVAIFIDALDQLRAPYRQAWLPLTLNIGVKLIISVLDDAAYAEERAIVEGMRRSLSDEAFLAIEPLSENDGADILSSLQLNMLRGTTLDQRTFILERFVEAGASPLWLRVAFAIASRWRSTDDPRKRGLAANTASLIGQFINELSTVHHHPRALVHRALGFIAAGREGMTQSELIANLSRDGDVMRAISSENFGATADRLPDSVWVRLRRSLDALLVEKGVHGEPLLNFFHRQARDVVRARCYEDEKLHLHRELAEFFCTPRALHPTDSRFSRRSLAELPFQLFHSGRRTRLDELLLDPTWIDAHVRTFNGPFELLVDYTHFKNAGHALQTSVLAALRIAAPILVRKPQQVLTQLHARLLGRVSPQFTDALFDCLPLGTLHCVKPSFVTPHGEVAQLGSHSDEVLALAVLDDGTLASGSADGSICIWDTALGRLITSMKCEHSVELLAVLPNRGLASRSDLLTIRIWDAGTGVEKHRLHVNAHVTALAALPNGHLVAARKTGEVVVFDVEQESELACFSCHREPVTALVLLPNGLLATGSDDSTIRIWDMNAEAVVATLIGHKERVSGLVLSKDGKLVSGSYDGTIKQWDINTWRLLATIETNVGSVLSLAALDDGRIASGGVDKAITIWDMKSHTKMLVFKARNHVQALAVLPDQLIASGGINGVISVWSAALESNAEHDLGHDGLVRVATKISEDRLASIAFDGTVCIWNSQTGACISKFEHRSGAIFSVAALLDGRLVVGSKSGEVSVISTSGDATRRSLGFHDGAVSAIAVMADGRPVTVSEDATLRVWNADGGEEWRQRHSGEGLTSLVVLPDGRMITSGRGKTLLMWDTRSRSVNEFAHLNDAHVYQLLLLTDGRLAGVTREAIRIWNVDTGAEEDCIDVGRLIFALAPLSDGRLASIESGGSVYVWDDQLKARVAEIELDSQPHSLVALDDGRLVAGGREGQVHWLATKRTTTPRSPSVVRVEFPDDRLMSPIQALGQPKRHPRLAGFGWWCVFAVVVGAALCIVTPGAREAFVQLLGISAGH